MHTKQTSGVDGGVTFETMEVYDGEVLVVTIKKIGDKPATTSGIGAAKAPMIPDQPVIGTFSDVHNDVPDEPVKVYRKPKNIE